VFILTTVDARNRSSSLTERETRPDQAGAGVEGAFGTRFIPHLLEQKQKEHRIAPVLLTACTLRRSPYSNYLSHYCCNGCTVLAHAPAAIGPIAWKRTTPSSTEQKARTPLWFWVIALDVALYVVAVPTAA
jgi:hypothetical protein